MKGRISNLVVILFHSLDRMLGQFLLVVAVASGQAGAFVVAVVAEELVVLEVLVGVAFAELVVVVYTSSVAVVHIEAVDA